MAGAMDNVDEKFYATDNQALREIGLYLCAVLAVITRKMF